jgi:hypothetical protein
MASPFEKMGEGDLIRRRNSEKAKHKMRKNKRRYYG